MKLDIILRTCQKSLLNNAKFNRICGQDRDVMIYRCLMSLINSINISRYNIELTILDDNSDSIFIERLSTLLSRCNKKYNFIKLNKEGFNNSAYEQFYRGSQCEDLVYLVEDDYLHDETAIDSILNAYYYLSKFYDNEVIIFPFDCPFNYEPGKEEKTILLYDGQRYWRHTKKTSNTFLTSSKQLLKNFECYKALALNYPNLLEDETINKLYFDIDKKEGEIFVFSPLPSCAYHLSYQEPAAIKTSHIKWEDLWDVDNYLHMFQGWYNYKNFVDNVILNLPNNSKIIEIGSWLGKSTIGMANTIKKLKKTLNIYAIDTWNGSKETEHVITIENLKRLNRTPYDEFLDNIHLYGVENFITPIRKTSEQASITFPDSFADLIIIDGAHDYQSVLNDIKYWLPKVKKGGIIAGDDFHESWPEVQKAVTDFFGENNFGLYESTWFKVIN